MMSVIVREEPDDAGRSTRERMIVSAAALFREHGYSGTGFRDVVAHSGAPRGSIYHHFPGGKAQLARETIGYAADVVATVIERGSAAGDPLIALRATLDWWRATLVASDYRAGCPIVAVTVESHEPALTEAADRAFARWERVLASALRDGGVDDQRAARLATLAIAAVEGAVIRCRAARDTAALDEVGRELETIFREARG
jgi:AcrR family transcriptional regulator